MDKTTIIKVDDGGMFEGSIEQFANCFFSNATLSTIQDWCAKSGYKLEILVGTDIVIEGFKPD